MIGNINSNYKAICELFDFSKETSADKKRKLFKLAANKKAKRPSNKTTLGIALASYTSKKSKSYDPDFTNKIRKMKPDWFLFSKNQAVVDRKNEFLRMAKKGMERPTNKTKLGKFLICYTCKGSKLYDDKFNKKIRKARPDWFRNTDSIKKKILKLSRNKGKIIDEKLRACLRNYTREESTSFDALFNAKIRKLRPDWFLSKSKLMSLKKDQIIKIAKSRKKITRKELGSSLNQSLRHYTCKKSAVYDGSFDKTIRKLQPDWFKDNANDKKKEILNFASLTEVKPKHLINVLRNYTNKKSKCYDIVFDKKIRKLRPDWFISQSQRANENKKELLRIAKNNEKRPKSTSRLGILLRSYMCKRKKRSCFDLKFTKEIKALRPDWFRK